MNSAGNKILTFISLVAIVGAAYVAYAKIYPMYFAPCGKPVTYVIANIDSRFDLSKTDLENALAEAEAIWEKPSGHNLFEDTASGKVAVSLVYDYRQEAMDRLKSIGITIDNSRKSYDALNVQYKSSVSSYENQKAQIASLISQYDKLKTQYEQHRTKAQYDELVREQNYLNSLADQINSKQEPLKRLVDDINAMVALLNQSASQLNLNVNEYNQVGQTTGNEFQEGVYSQDSAGRRIDIYEFTSHEELVRVLSHELGHALGLEHVADPDAIMYKLNQSKNGTATTADISELNRVCRF